MVIKYTITFKGRPKFTQIWDFWFENEPSGNPGKNLPWQIEDNKC
jgi:hypothetical protein